MINSLELMSHYTLYQLRFPANCLILFRAIFELMDFEIMPEWIGPLLESDSNEEEPYN